VTTFNTLPLLDIKPTVAYRLARDLSIGAGADIYTFSGLIGEGHVEQQSISPGGLAPPGQKLELSGRDTAPGFNLSVLYTAWRNASGQPVANLGFVYRSEATLQLTGALSANGRKLADAASTLVLPRVMSGALAVWPVRSPAHEWKLEVDVDYVDWKSVQNLDVRLGNGTVIPQPQNWHSTYAVMAGTEVRWLALESLPGWEVAARTGYTHQASQMPDRGFNPGVPSANAHIVAAGFGMLCKEAGTLLGLIPCGRFSKAIGVDLSYQASLYEDRTVAGNTGVRAGVNGVYKTTLHTGGLSVRMNF
jgi:long-chain fatty acid transport protein